MADDDIEIGEDVDVEIVADGDGNVLGAIVDDIVVATAPEGSIVDETIDVLDDQGNVLLEDETVSVFDADANLIAQEETVVIALEDD
jgi:myo-inositol-hexaphosphate 3-phosphohydrolase